MNLALGEDADGTPSDFRGWNATKPIPATAECLRQVICP